MTYGVEPDPAILFLVGFVMCCLNAASNFWNQVFDADIDAINAPGRPIPSGQARKDVTMQAGGAIALVAVGLTVHFGRPIVTYVVAGILIAAWAYSAPPLRLKARLWLGPLAIATPRGGLGLLGAYLVYGHPDAQIAILGLTMAVFVYFGNISKDIPDIRGDAAFGVRTVANTYGLRKCRFISVAGMIIGTASVGILGGIATYSTLLHFLLLPIYRSPRSLWRFFYVQYTLLVLSILVPVWV